MPDNSPKTITKTERWIQYKWTDEDAMESYSHEMQIVTATGWCDYYSVDSEDPRNTPKSLIEDILEACRTGHEEIGQHKKFRVLDRVTQETVLCYVNGVAEESD